MEEKLLYDEVLKKFKLDLDNIVSNQSKTKKYAILFSMVMKLRRLRNHGTLITTAPLSLATAMSLGSESSCDYCQESQEDSLARLNKDQVCPECSRILSSSSKILATPTLSRSQDSAQPFGANSPASSELRDEGLLRILPNLASIEEKCSTKLTAVVEDLKMATQDSKSLVFSYWTSTLDLLQNLLAYNNIPSLRIDGRISYEQRLQHLERFRNDPKVTVLLMSIQTGAVGLNLTVANRVHIIEPQWNPSVEEQAIARALRMGQTRTVTVIRYSMMKTVEENIQNMQKKKKNLAKFTLDGADGDFGSLEDLKFMLNIK